MKMSQIKSFDIEPLACLTDEAFVYHCFVLAFRRVCNPSRAKHYLAALANGTSRGDVVRSIFQEDEFTHQVHTAALRNLSLLDGELFLREAYRRILGRPIDNGGLKHYSQCLSKGEKKKQILYDLATSAEGQARQALYRELSDFVEFLSRGGVVPQGPVRMKDIRRLLALKDDEFIPATYRLLLGREADAAGLAVYQQAMRNGLSKIKILYSLAYSNEGRHFHKSLSVRLYLTLGRFV